MMNNCQKCGNPLQPGTASCPICGTIINNESTNLMGNTNVPTSGTSLNQNIVEQPMNVQNEQVQNMMQQQPVAQSVNQIATEPIVQQPTVEAPIPAQQPVEQVTNNPAAFGTQTTMQQQPVINQSFQTPVVEATTQTMNQPQVQTQTQVVQPNNTTPETIQSVQPVAINNVQSTPVQEQITQPIQEQVVQQVQPVAQPVNQPEQLNVQSQPTITEQAQQNTVIEPLTANAGIPSSLTPGTIHPINVPEQKKTKKFTINNKTLLIAGGVFVVLLVVIFVLTSNSLGKNNTNNNQNQTQNENNTQTPPEENVLAITDTTINNYFLKIPDGWTASAYSGDVAITNSNETAYALISSVSGDLSQTNETIIKNNIIQQEIENVVVESTTVDDKKAYKVTFVEEGTYPAEIYYIDYDGTRIICAYTIYNTESDKEKYNEDLISILETVIYSNKTQNAIDPNGIYLNKLMKMRGFPFLQAIEPEEPEQPEEPDEE